MHLYISRTNEPMMTLAMVKIVIIFLLKPLSISAPLVALVDTLLAIRLLGRTDGHFATSASETTESNTS